MGQIAYLLHEIQIKLGVAVTSTLAQVAFCLFSVYLLSFLSALGVNTASIDRVVWSKTVRGRLIRYFILCTSLAHKVTLTVTESYFLQ